MTRPRSYTTARPITLYVQTHKYMRYILQERTRARGVGRRCVRGEGRKTRGRKAKEEEEEGAGVCSHRGCRNFSPASSSFCAVACYDRRRRRSRAAVAAAVARPSAGRRDEVGPLPGPRESTSGHRRLSHWSSLRRPVTTCRVFLLETRRLVPARTRRGRRAACPPETQNRVSCYANTQRLCIAARRLPTTPNKNGPFRLKVARTSS